MKYWKYFKYVVRHKWYVMIECFKHGLIWRGIMHDMSKFRPSEFLPYANFFYGYQVEKETGYQTQANMDMAWLQHMHRNDHHWQHWVLQEDSGQVFGLDIPHKVVVEMVCDWIGAGKAQHSTLTCVEWYKQHKHKMTFSALTQCELEVFLFNLKFSSKKTGEKQ